MKAFNFWIFLVIIILLVSAIIYCISLNTKNKVVDEKIIIAMIGALTAIISIIGSIFVNQNLALENSRQQRELEIRKVKQEYYHKFTESFMLKLTYASRPTSSEYKEADKTFCLEKNRLPLYASQELVEWVDSVTRGTNQSADFKILYELIRKDLYNNDFCEFEKLKDISVTLPGL